MTERSDHSHRRANLILAVVIVLSLWQLGVPKVSALREWWRARENARTAGQLWSELARGPSIQIGEARDTVVMFTDYQCPYCAVQESLFALGDAEGLLVVLRHRPLTAIHTYASRGAAISACAAHGPRFSEVHAEMFRSSGWQADSTLDRWLTDLAGSGDQASLVMACIAEGRGAQEVARDERWADELGIRQTPTFVVPGAIVVGTRSLSELRDLARGRH